jgi:ABC-2 type transport system ATP-binding protein
MVVVTAQPLAVYKALVKRYGRVTAVDGLSFTVPEGTVCGLLGPNGAGKTTAIRALLGLAAPSAGSTTLLGERPGTPGFAAAVRRVGTLIEGPALYGRATARQNMRIEAAALSLGDAEGQIDELLAMVGLTDRADTRAGKFSMGMKQRLGLALALLGEPRLVVLDEPTNGLDPAGIVEIRKLIKELPARGTTVLVSSHQLTEVELMCDRAMILHRGRLLAEGTIAELLARHGGAGYATRVAEHEAERAAEILRRAGLTVTPKDDGRLAVAGEIDDGAQVSRPLSEEGIHVRELWHEGARLEGVFLALTGDGDEDGAALAEVTP